MTVNDMASEAFMIRGELLRNLIDRGGKDINKECGYPDIITPAYCKQLYDREGIAKRVVRFYPEECWKQDPEVLETDDDTDTEFELAWKSLQKKFNLYATLQRADIMSGIGTFGVVLLGIDDGKQLIEPVAGVPLDGTAPKTFPKSSVKGQKGDQRKKAYNLLYIRVFDESAVTINKFEIDITSPRYGQPLLYNINFIQYGTNTQVVQPVAPMPTSPTPVHWTRVVHLADNRESSEVYGVPRMQPVINRLIDLRKVLGGSGEMFWKGGFPGISFEVNPELQTVAQLDPESMRKEFEAYQSGMQRYLALVGVTAKSLSVELADPNNHITVHMQSIACSLGIPWRVFMGTEEAKLAADQDSTAWNERVANRQQKYVGPMLLQPFVNRLINIGILPPLADMDEGLTIKWTDLHTPSDAEKAEIASSMMTAVNSYMTAGADVLVPPKLFLTMFMNFSDDEADAILKEGQKYMGAVGGLADKLHPPATPTQAPGATQPTPAGGAAQPNAGKGGVGDTQVGNFPNGGAPGLQIRAQTGKTSAKAGAAAQKAQAGGQSASPPAAPSLKKPNAIQPGVKPTKNEVPSRFAANATAYLAGRETKKLGRSMTITKQFVMNAGDRHAFRAGFLGRR